MQLRRVVVWQALHRRWLERCSLWEGDGWTLEGIVVGVVDDDPAEVRYRVRCGLDWATRHVEATAEVGNETRAVRLEADAEQRWWLDGHQVVEGQGAFDVDLGFTPATNTLPIRRLQLGVGEASQILAVWVRFPEMTVEPFPQRYTKLTADRYRYESLDGDFTADLDVDDLGLVVRYPGGWDRVAAFDPRPVEEPPSG